MVITFLAYLPALRGGFIWDDDSWTTGIAGLLRDLPGLQTMWLHSTSLQQYYPLTGTSFWLDYHLWCFRALPCHAENVLLHAMAALLFWKLLQRLQVRGAWLAAAIFALHPVMVESVAWITERKNVLSLVFYLAALLAYDRYASGMSSRQSSAGKRPATRTAKAAVSPDPPRGACHPSLFYGLAFVLFLGALLAKTTTFSLPAVILLICWWKQNHIRWRADVLPTLPFFALAIGLCLVTAWLEKNHVGAQGRDFSMTFMERCQVAGRIPWFYAGKLFWPDNLCFVYPRWQPDVRSGEQWLYPLATMGLLFGLWIARRRMGRGPVAAVFFFAGTLFPVLGFMNAYGMRYSFVWDHWVYLPSLGLIALAAALAVRGTEYLRTPAMVYGLATLGLPVLAVLTWHQCGMYADNETLWQITIAKNPNATLAHNNLGNLRAMQGRLDEALRCYQKVIQINPKDPEANYNLGMASAQQDRLDEAIAYFKTAIQANPNDARAHYNLAVLFGSHGNPDQAVEHYQKAIQIKPDYAEAHNNLANLLAAQGRLQEAVEQYQKAVQFKPDHVGAHYNLANALGSQGRLDEAAEHYRKCIELNPSHADAHSNLANLLATQGKLNEAVVEYQRTIQLIPNSAQAHFRFGQALQAQHYFKMAITEYQRALELDPRHLPVHLNLAWLLATNPDDTLRDGNKAVELVEQAGALAGAESPQILDTLAAAYAEAGRFPEAVKTAQRGLNLPATRNNQPLADAIQSRLKLYEARTPFREKP